jgi:hypothetical protein
MPLRLPPIFWTSPAFCAASYFFTQPHVGCALDLDGVSLCRSSTSFALMPRSEAVGARFSSGTWLLSRRGQIPDMKCVVRSLNKGEDV